MVKNDLKLCVNHQFIAPSLYNQITQLIFITDRAVFTWLSKGIGFGFTTPFGWLVYLLWFWIYDSQVKTALYLDRR